MNMNDSTEDKSGTGQKFEDLFHFSLETNVHFRNVFGSMMVINAVSSFLAIVLNVLIVLTFVKTPSLRTPSYILVLSLAISDFGVGVVGETLYCSLLYPPFSWDERIFDIFVVALDVFITASLLTIAAITIDRYLAVHLHLRYQELVTTKRYYIVVMIIWIVSLSLLVSIAIDIILDIYTIIFLVMIISTIILMLKICRVVNRHSAQIKAEQQAVQHNMNIQRHKKSVNTMYYVCGAFIVCYCPDLLINITCLALGSNSEGELKLYSAHIFAFTLLLINSVFNPIIYFLRIQEMRNAVVQLLRSVRCR